MASDVDRPDEKSSRVGADLIIPIASILLVIYYFSTIINSVWTAQVTAFFVGAILVLVSGIYIVGSILPLVRGQARFSLLDLIEPLPMASTKGILLFLTVASVFLMPVLGFTLTAILFLMLSMLLLMGGRTPVLIVSLAVSLSFLWFVVFVLIFQRRFPLGWLDDQLKAAILPFLKSMGLG